ncbi:MAG: prephenate dehydrogenase/arogenate dehydrogenase family protein [Methylotenera sp.]|nr:prephenate dehydrogenase/arogenate dehydrogenase family protein [Methylotenera sp.]
MNKLVIFGVGLIGGSVALALKKAGFVAHIVGVGRSEASLQEALSLGVIDSFSDALEANIHAACSDADLILIAAPVAQTASILQSIKPHLNCNTIITDAGSTKSDVLACAREVLGEQFNQFVGGHPIAGAEKSGVSAAKADLFVGKNVVLTPALNNNNAPETNIHALASVAQLWQACGAKVSEMSAEKHDSIFAAVSHLPHLLAFALVDDIAARPNAEQLFSFAASGFRDFTRIAGSHPEMWRDISLANKTALLSEISAFQTELSIVKKLLENDDAQGLQALFERASVARNNWANNNKPA